jgi:hypothetical protein
MEYQASLFMDSFRALWTQLAAFIPQLAGAMILLFLGWIAAKFIRKAFGRALTLLKFDGLGQKTGIETFLRQGGINSSLSELLALLVYWLMLMIVIVTVANSLGLTAVAGLFNRVVLYLPNIMVATLVVVLGSLMARFLHRLILAFLNNLQVSGALTLSNMAEYALLVFVMLVALEQLQIGTQLLLTAFQISFGAIALALALAFGLGGRDWAAGVIKRMTDKGRKP